MYKNSLKLKNISTRDLCFMAMLIAITIVLSAVSGYLRIGNSIKFSISFISVYVGAAIYGPIAGGVIAAIADIVSFVINPTGPYIPVFTVMEFINGMFFGLFLYHEGNERSSYIKMILPALICVMLQFSVNMFWRTYELSLLYHYSFRIKFIERLPSNMVMVVCKLMVITAFEPYILRFKMLVTKQKY